MPRALWKGQVIAESWPVPVKEPSTGFASVNVTFPVLVTRNEYPTT